MTTQVHGGINRNKSEQLFGEGKVTLVLTGIFKNRTWKCMIIAGGKEIQCSMTSRARSIPISVAG